MTCCVVLLYMYIYSHANVTHSSRLIVLSTLNLLQFSWFVTTDFIGCCTKCKTVKPPKYRREFRKPNHTILYSHHLIDNGAKLTYHYYDVIRVYSKCRHFFGLTDKLYLLVCVRIFTHGVGHLVTVVVWFV